MTKHQIPPKRFRRPDGHQCNTSADRFGRLTFGTGRLDENGLWEFPCAVCARSHEEQIPGVPCWPTESVITSTGSGQIVLLPVAKRAIKGGS